MANSKPRLKTYQSKGLWYVTHRVTGRPILRGLRERPSPEYLASPQFRALYDGTGEIAPAPTAARPAGPKPRWSVGYAVGFYLASDKYKALSFFTRRNRGPALEAFREEYGDEDIGTLDRATIVAVIGKVPLASEQRKLRSALSDLCSVLCEETTPQAIRLPFNPAVGIKTKKMPETDGWPMWTDDDCAKFERHFPLGTQQRLAYEIMRWTALRIRDAVRLGPDHVKKVAVNGKTITMISLVPIKTRKQPLSRMFAQMTPQLRRAIDAAPVVGLKTFVVNRGHHKVKSWPANGQPTKWFIDACQEAGIRKPKGGRGQLAAHGLRKYRLVELLHQGWTYEQLMRLSGHTSRVTLEKYLRGADREMMALEQAAREWTAA